MHRLNAGLGTVQTLVTGSAARGLAYSMVSRKIMGRMTGGALEHIDHTVVDKTQGGSIRAAVTGGARTRTVSRRVVHCFNA